MKNISQKKLKRLIREQTQIYLLEQKLQQELIQEGIAGNVFKYLKDTFVNGVHRLAMLGGGELTVQRAMQDFILAYSEMMGFNVRGSDKYFHCIANNMATQRGWAGKAFAIVFSELREIVDLIKPTGMSFSAKLQDRREDLEANELGREMVGDPRQVINAPRHLEDDYLAAIDACRTLLPPCARLNYSDDKGTSVARFDGDFAACSGYIRQRIAESMRVDGLDRVFDQMDADQLENPTINPPLPMAGARETFSQDTGLFGSNVERPDDMRDMNVPSTARRKSDKILEARYAIVYFRSYISTLSLYMKIHYVHAQEWKDWKRTPGAMSALNLVTRKVNTGFGTMTDAAYDHGILGVAHDPQKPGQVELLREAEAAGKMDVEEKIRLEGYASAYIAVNDMVFVGHTHHLMPVQTAAETLGDRELVSLMGIFEGFDEDVNNGKVLELFDFLDRFDHDYQVLR